MMHDRVTLQLESFGRRQRRLRAIHEKSRTMRPAFRVIDTAMQIDTAIRLRPCPPSLQ